MGCCCLKSRSYSAINHVDADENGIDFEEEEDGDDDEKETTTNTQKAKNILIIENIVHETYNIINENLSWCNGGIIILILTKQIPFSLINNWIKLLISIILTIIIIIFYGFFNDKIDFNHYNSLKKKQEKVSVDDNNNNNILSKQDSLRTFSEEEKLSLAGNISILSNFNPNKNEENRRNNHLSISSSIIVNIDDNDDIIDIDQYKDDEIVIDSDDMQIPPSPINEQHSIDMDENIIIFKTPSRSINKNKNSKHVMFDIEENKHQNDNDIDIDIDIDNDNNNNIDNYIEDKLRNNENKMDQQFYSMTKWIEKNDNIFKDNVQKLIYMILSIIISLQFNQILFHQIFVIFIKHIIINPIIQNLLYTLIITILSWIIIRTLNKKYYQILNDWNHKLLLNTSNKTIFIYLIYESLVNLFNQIIAIIIALVITDLVKVLIFEANSGNKLFILYVITIIFYPLLIAMIFTLNQSFYFCYKRENNDNVLQNKIERVLIYSSLKYSTGLIWYYLIYTLLNESNITLIIYLNLILFGLIFSIIFTYIYHYYLINKAIKNKGFIQTIYAKVNELDIAMTVTSSSSSFCLLFILKLIELIITSMGIATSLGLINIINDNNNKSGIKILCIMITILNILILISCSYIISILQGKRRKIFKKFRRHSFVLQV